MRRGILTFIGVLAMLAIFSWPQGVGAQYASPSYKIDETFIGSGGELELCSSQYCSRQAAGELGVGETTSPTYKSQAGFNTTSDPLLEVTVTNNIIDFGILTASSTASGAANFSVRNYLSSGYSVKILGSPPTNNSGNHPLTALAAATTSAIGTEQFGINLVDNATPNIGVNPVGVPDASFSSGQAATGYSTADNFKFVDGDEIAKSTSSSGQTNYTISFIANVSTVTPGGQYKGIYYILVVATF